MFNADNPNKFLIGGLIAILLIIGAILLNVFSPVDLFHMTITPTPTMIVSQSKTVKTSNLPLQEIWRWSGTIASGHTPNLVITDNHLVLAAFDSQVQARIIAFDINTGEKVWERPYSATKAPNNFDSINADNARVYVGSGRYVQAFDLKDGQLLWTGADGSAGIPGPLNVYPQDDKIQGYSYYDYVLYILDSLTGETLETSTVPGILIRMAGTDYGEYGHDYVWAQNIRTQQLLWKQNLGKKIQLWPLFFDDTMYVSAGEDYGTDDRQIFALSIQTGKILWQSADEFVSNITYGQEMIFSVQGDASIVALSPESGQMVGQIAMEPAETFQKRGGQRRGDYLVAASNEYLATYYHDSRELIVFEWED